MPRMQQNTFSGRALLGPAGGAYALTQTLCHNGWPILLRGGRGGERPTDTGGRKGEKGEGPTSKEAKG